MKTTKGAIDLSRFAKLNQDDIKSICDAAQSAWDAAPASARQVNFTWRERLYRSRLTNMRMVVETAGGEPVAARYH